MWNTMCLLNEQTEQAAMLNWNVWRETNRKDAMQILHALIIIGFRSKIAKVCMYIYRNIEKNQLYYFSSVEQSLDWTLWPNFKIISYKWSYFFLPIFKILTKICNLHLIGFVQSEWQFYDKIENADQFQSIVNVDHLVQYCCWQIQTQYMSPKIFYEHVEK